MGRHFATGGAIEEHAITGGHVSAVGPMLGNFSTGGPKGSQPQGGKSASNSFKKALQKSPNIQTVSQSSKPVFLLGKSAGPANESLDFAKVRKNQGAQQIFCSMQGSAGHSPETQKYVRASKVVPSLVLRLSQGVSSKKTSFSSELKNHSRYLLNYKENCNKF